MNIAPNKTFKKYAFGTKKLKKNKNCKLRGTYENMFQF
jgi:hypothetical protein